MKQCLAALFLLWLFAMVLASVPISARAQTFQLSSPDFGPGKASRRSFCSTEWAAPVAMSRQH